MREYWKTVHRRACAEILQALGVRSRGDLVIRALFAAGAIAALYFYSSSETVRDQVITVAGGIAAALAIFLFLYAWKLLGIPPAMAAESAAEIESLKSVKIDGQIQRLEQWVRQERSFFTGHAACLLAGQELVAGAPTGLAAGVLSRIKHQMRKGAILPIGSPMDMAKFKAAEFGIHSHDEELSTLLKLKISKSDLSKLADDWSVEVPGLTEDAAPAPQSLPSTATETQR